MQTSYWKSIVSILFVSFSLFVTSSFAEKTESKEASEESPGKKKPFTHRGIFYGYIYAVRDNYILVRPNLDNDGAILNALPNQTQAFYLDKKTEVRVDMKKTVLDDVWQGDKVAVRYFGQEWLKVADVIFVLLEDKKYVPRKYMPKRKGPPPAKEGAEGGGHGAPAKEESGGGGHGAAKPAPAKGGGGH